MKTMKALALMLAVLMLVSTVLAGCSKAEDNKGDDNVVKTEEKVDESTVYDAKIHDLGGHEFWFLVRDVGSFQHLTVNEIYSEEMNGEKINDAVFKRNSLLQETYNCEIREERVKNPVNSVKEQLLAGEYVYDYIYCPTTSLRTLSAQNLLVDFQGLDTVNLEKSWWDHNAITGLSIGNKAFYVTGAGSTLDERASWIMFFNKDVLIKSGIDLPYDLVKEGKWTIDKMYEIMTTTVEDLDGNGIMEIGKDRFGYIGQPENNWFHVAACNVKLSDVSSTGDIDIPPTVNKDVLNAWAALKPLLTSEFRDVGDSGKRFRSGFGTFFSCLSGAILNMNDGAFNFGVLPMPKLNEEQKEYWTSADGVWTYSYAIPVTTDNASDAEENGFSSGSNQAGYFLEAMFYHSLNTLNVAFNEQVLKYQSIKDAESVEMMEIALKNKIYDPVVLFDFGKMGAGSLFGAAGSNGGQTAGQGPLSKGSDVNYDTLVSLYESRVTAARKALNNYINYITNED
ncbi:MAG: hypothetical protein J6Z79_04985 [Clostridia bacterium]|nr:hypothetical protein [Clostridia bacterium]